VGADVSPPIYDQPGHPTYGPARRLHVMLMQLAADVSMDRLLSHYAEHHIGPWDAHLDLLIDVLGFAEAAAQRIVLRDLLWTMDQMA
jgi:hypothetical protein